MIILFTDYGLLGPYIGQVEAVLHIASPQSVIVDLFADLPRQNPKASAYLIDAYTRNYPEGTIFFCVVDPGVGSFIDNPVVMKLDNHWYVGPDNGIFDIVTRQSRTIECWKINWRPEKLSATFHGRDLYAPVCAMIANGLDIPGEKINWKDNHRWPDNLNEIIYIDHFGNCMTGLHGSGIEKSSEIRINDQNLGYVSTFSDTAEEKPFWYVNSNDLVEMAVNRGSAAKVLGLEVGQNFVVKK
jgi:S-adenosyl-L-methionine hydrolase (adenosine-forming)